MTIHNSRRRLSRWRPGYVAPWILAGPVMIGSAATAQEPNSSQITPPQHEVMRHLAELYEQNGRETSSIHLNDAQNSDIPWGMTILALDDSPTSSNVAGGVRTIAAEEEESRDGFFSFFRRDDSGVTSRTSERPSFFGRVRNRMMRPFRDDQSEQPEPESETAIADEARGSNFSPPTPPARPGTIIPPPAPSGLPPAPRTARAEGANRRTMTPVDENEQPNLVPLPTGDLEMRRRTSEREFDAASEPPRAHAPAAEKTFPPPPPAANPEPMRRDRLSNVRTPVDKPIHDSRYIALTRKLAERQGLVGMQGYCPVALREQQRLVDARPEFLCIYRGRTYRVSSAEAKARFDAHPSRYAPAAGGFDVVLNSRGEPGIDGMLANAIWYQDQLYLFRTPETAQAFNADPQRYVRE